MAQRVNKPTITVWGINGSPQKSGLCVKLLKRLLKGSRNAGAQIRLIHLSDYEKALFKLGDIRTPPPAIKSLLDQIKNGKPNCLVLATPIHWFQVSTLMKCFIDHLSYLEDDRTGSNNYELEGVVAAFLATGEEDGGMKAVLDMLGPLNHMGALIPPYATHFYNRKMAKKSEDRWMEKVDDVGRVVVQLATATKGISSWG